MGKAKNLLFILADQFRADCIGAAGNPVIQTPNLDALAREGALFTECFGQTAPCGPSRMCIYTGRYLCSHRTTTNKVPLIDAEDNLAMALRDGGFGPGLIGYNDYAVDPRTLPEDDPRTRTLNYDNCLPGFDEILYHEYDSPAYFDDLRAKGYPEALCNHDAIHKPAVPASGPGEHLPLFYPAHYTEEDSECRFLTRRAMDFVTQRAGSGWALSLNYIKPHPPRICPAPFHAMYDPADMPGAIQDAKELDTDHPYLRWLHRNPQLTSDRDLRETQANYYGMISEVDTSLGLLFDALKQTGQWDDTLIVFSSDHGEYLGDHFLTGKGSFFDGALRVPLIVRDPSPEADATRGETVDGFCESIDIAPTILDCLGQPVPDRMQGSSLRERLAGNGFAKEAVYFEKDFRPVQGVHPDRCLLWMVRTAETKFVQFADPSMPPLLYDLTADPRETVNVAEDPAYVDRVLAGSQNLLRWRMRNEDQRMAHWHAEIASR